MSEDRTALMPLPRPAAKGALRATLAFIMAFVALGLSSYTVWVQSETEPRVVVPLISEGTEGSPLQSRIQAQENVNATLAAEVGKLQQEIDALKGEGAAPAKENPVSDAKLDELSQSASALEKKLQESEARQARALKVFALLQAIRQRMQDGAAFDAPLDELALLAPSGDASITVLKNYQADPTPDAELLGRWQRISADLATQAKVAGSKDVLDKVSIQLQKLVTIHPKGQAAAPVPATAGIDKALREQRFDAALTQAESLNVQNQADFADWLQKLRLRAAAEKAVAGLQDTLVAPPVPAPAATQAQ